MTRNRSTLLTFTFSIMLLAGCSGTDDGGTVPSPAPEITSIFPDEGPAGTAVTIKGSGFSSMASENTVTFNDTEAQVNSATESQIKTSVPEGATSGPVKVSVDGEIATGPGFTVAKELPGITSLEPDSGVVGTEILIRGVNFSPDPSENSVTFNDGVVAPVLEASDSTLLTEVPEGAISGPVEVNINGEYAAGPEFKVLNRPPAAFALLEPADGVTDMDLQPDFSWEDATDPEGDPVSYQFFLDSQTPPEQLTEDDINDTFFSLQASLDYNRTYYWNVIAGDDQGAEKESEIFSFTTRKDQMTQIASVAEFNPRRSHTSLNFDGKVWIVGGYSNDGISNDVWYSTDGEVWTQATDSADFTPRYDHASVVYDGKIWVIGGRNSSIGEYYNDVWYSSDGENWTQATDAAAFSERSSLESVVFDNKMWVIGGSGRNDVWYSSDGVTWEEATSSANFSRRHDHTSVVFDNKMWVIGGRYTSGTSTRYYDEVWYSNDGVSWEKASAGQFPERSAHSSLVFNDKMWVIGGRYFSTRYNDIWYSSDGIEWRQATGNDEFTSRIEHASINFNNKLWIIGGNAGGFLQNDVWRLY